MSAREQLWWTRAGRLTVLAVVIYLALTAGLDAPWAAYVFLAGMFFGPDVWKQFGPDGQGP